MLDLQFTSVEAFNHYSQKVARNSKTVKLNPLRIAMAAADGFQSVDSYRTALNEHEADLARFTADEGTYLTNGSMEDTEHVKMDYLERLGLPFQTDVDYGTGIYGFYPLSEEEEAFLSDEPLETPYGYNLSMGYTVLHNKVKCLVVGFEVNFEDNDEYAHAEQDYAALKAPLVRAARHFDGAKVYYPSEVAVEWEEGNGHFECALYVPFDAAKNVASEHEGWQAYLTNLFTALSMGWGVHGTLSDEQLSQAIEARGQYDFDRNALATDTPFPPASVFADQWRSGWYKAREEKAVPAFMTRIDALTDAQKDEFQIEMDGLVHDAFDRIAEKTNPHDAFDDEEEWETFNAEKSFEASELNNQGLEAQMRFILEGRDGEALIEQRLKQATEH